jgi:hypothetical protein
MVEGERIPVIVDPFDLDTARAVPGRVNPSHVRASQPGLASAVGRLPSLRSGVMGQARRLAGLLRWKVHRYMH